MDSGNDDLDTWPAQLEAKLQRDTNYLARHGVARVEIINAGVGGWRTREGLLRLKQEVVGFSPDIIVIAFNWNDPWNGLEGNDPNAAKLSTVPFWYHSTLLQNLLIRYLILKSNDVDLYNARLLNLRRETPWAKAYIQNILEMWRIAQGIEAKVMLINLPGLCREPTLGSSEYQLIVENTRVTTANYPFLVKIKSFVSELLWDLAHEHGIPLVDVHQYFEQFEGERRIELFTDEMHTTKLGSEKIAQAIYLANSTY